jgi:hypothetical protein
MKSSTNSKGKIIILIIFGLLFTTCLIIYAIILSSPPAPQQTIDQTQAFETALASLPTPTPTPTPPPTNPPTASERAQRYVDEYSGGFDAYVEIFSSNDCAFLQDKFDIAAGNNERAEPGTAEFKWTLGFMLASDERMQEINCY